MANLKTDSPISRRIVRSFLDFLNSVEPTPGVDLEGLEVVRECLDDVFKLNSSSNDDPTQPGLLVEYFSSLDANQTHDSKQSHAANLVDTPSTSSTRNADESLPQMPKPQGEDFVGEPQFSGVSKDELFGQFFSALDKVHFLSTSDGDDDHGKLDRATQVFHEAVMELERSGCQKINSLNLADAFKSKGNKAMQSKSYSDAIELYTYAIALCQNNSVYYCNRAAAFTQINKYTEAIRDSEKSIELDPNYSKAYSRLGLAYYAQGNYRDAIDKGFMKAQQLDPENESIKENIRVSEQKLRDPHRTEQQDRTNGPARGGPRNHNVPPPGTAFTSMSFSPDLAPEITNMFINLAGQPPQGRTNVGGDTARSEDEPEIRIDADISLNVGEDLPDDFLGTWRSVMGMFSGAQPHQNPQGPAPN